MTLDCIGLATLSFVLLNTPLTDDSELLGPDSEVVVHLESGAPAIV